MALVIAVTLVIISFSNIIVHCIGLHLLLCLVKNSGEGVQQTYIINLSAVEIFGNILWFCIDLLNLTKSIVTPFNFTDIYAYLSFVTCTTFLFVYYMSMVYITVDKLLEILLHIKYPLYWNTRNAKYLVKATWLLGFVFCISIIAACKFGGFQYELPFVKYVYPTFDFLFIFIVVACYGYIIHMFKQTRSHPSFRTTALCVSRHQPGIIGVFRKSRFYITFFLISTFLVCVIIPDLTYLFSIIENNDVIKSPSGVLLILYHVSFFSDACIYIFLQARVRRLFWKKLRKVVSCCSRDSVKEQRYCMKHDVINKERHSLYSEDIVTAVSSV